MIFGDQNGASGKTEARFATGHFLISHRRRSIESIFVAVLSRNSYRCASAFKHLFWLDCHEFCFMSNFFRFVRFRLSLLSPRDPRSCGPDFNSCLGEIVSLFDIQMYCECGAFPFQVTAQFEPIFEIKQFPIIEPSQRCNCGFNCVNCTNLNFRINFQAVTICTGYLIQIVCIFCRRPRHSPI